MHKFVAKLLLIIFRDFMIALLVVILYPSEISQIFVIIALILCILIDCLAIATTDDLNFRFNLLMKVIRILIKRTKILDEIHADLQKLDDDLTESELKELIEDE